MKELSLSGKRLLPAMIDNGGGSIISLSSVVSSVKGVPKQFAYSASKAAVVGFTKAIAIDGGWTV